MRSGYFIPSCDHQTPPGISLADYRLYLRLLREYGALVCQSQREPVAWVLTVHSVTRREGMG